MRTISPERFEREKARQELVKTLSPQEREALRECLREMAGGSAAILIANQEDFAPANIVTAIINYGRKLGSLYGG